MVKIAVRGLLLVSLGWGLSIASGCGQGDVGTADTSLSIRVAGHGSGARSQNAPCNRLGDLESPAIQTLQVIVRSPSGAADCCIAFDPCDEVFAESRRILLSLPSDKELVDVTLSAFVEEEAPVDGEGAADVCVTVPRDAGRDCAPARCETFPLARGTADEVALAAGKTTVVTIDPDPLLALRDLDPMCGEAVEVPERLSFVALSITEFGEGGRMEIVQDGGRRQSYFPEIVEPTPLELELNGFFVVAFPGGGEDNEPAPPLNVGPAQVRIQFPADESSDSFLEASYPIEILPSLTPTASHTPRATATMSSTPTPTRTDTATPTATASNTLTASSTPTATRTDTATPTETSTAMPTDTFQVGALTNLPAGGLA